MMDDGRDIPVVTEIEKARWAAARATLDDLMGGLSEGTIDEDGVRACTNQLAQIDLDLPRIRDSLHIPDDAGPYRDALVAVMVRIPDNWGRWISCDAGWYPLVTALDAALAALDPDYVIHQVKEKFATLRYYAHTDQAAVRAQFDTLSAEAERRSAAICEKCGAPGELSHSASGWLKTLCRSCAQGLGFQAGAR